MRPRGLVDTGAILALIDRSDSWHERCAEAFESIALPLATTAAVLAELFHFVGDHLRARESAWRLLRSGAIRVLPIDDHDLEAIEGLMTRYADRPMDFADATLVRLADRESLSTIFTIDHDDFRTYRMRGGKTFRVVPDRIGRPRG